MCYFVLRRFEDMFQETMLQLKLLINSPHSPY